MMSRFFIPIMTAASICLAAEPATLIDAQLQRRSVQLVGYSDGTLRYFDEDRSLTSTAADRLVRLEFSRPSAKPSASLLRLNDGQVLLGRFEAVTDQGKLRWQTDDLGRIEIELDRIRSFQVRAPQGPAPPDATPAEQNDSIRLVNGDVLQGFVESLASKHLKLTRDGQTVELAWDRIAAVALANPVTQKPGLWVALASGHRLFVQNLQITGSRATFTAADRRIERPLSDIVNVDFAQKYRLVPLEQRTWKVVAGGRVLGVDSPPQWLDHTLQLRAPITLEFDLPPTATRLAAQPWIDPEKHDRADMTLNILQGPAERVTHHLKAGQPFPTLNIELKSTRLVFQLDEGPDGPIHDILQLKDPLLLVEQE